MVMLIARKSLNALQSHESLLNSLNRLCWHLSRLTQADMHAVLCVRRRPKQGPLHAACVGFSNTAFEPQSAVLHHQTAQIQLPMLHICSYGVCEVLRPARLQWYPMSG